MDDVELFEFSELMHTFVPCGDAYNAEPYGFFASGINDGMRFGSHPKAASGEIPLALGLSCRLKSLAVGATMSVAVAGDVATLGPDF